MPLLNLVQSRTPFPKAKPEDTPAQDVGFCKQRCLPCAGTVKLIVYYPLNPQI